MNDRARAGKQKSSGDMIADRNVHRNALAEPASWESENDVSPRGREAHFCGIALDTFSVMSCHKMPRTHAGVGAIEQHAIGADRLVPVMLNHHRLATKKSESERQQSGIRDMHNVGRPDLTDQFEQRGPTDDAKRQPGVIHAIGRGFSDQCYVDTVTVMGTRPLT